MRPIVLCVDDDRNLCQILGKALSGEGYLVRMAHDGDAALESLREEPPDLVLLDLLLPKRDGFAVLAREHGIPFYVAAPLSTLDLDTPTGAGIPIEERGRAEVAIIGGQMIVPEGVPVRHPAFDVTPARFVTAIITEAGVARPPYTESLAQLLRKC